MKKKSSVIAKLIIPVAVLGCIAIMIAGVSLYSMTAVQKESNQISGEGVRATICMDEINLAFANTQKLTLALCAEPSKDLYEYVASQLTEYQSNVDSYEKELLAMDHYFTADDIQLMNETFDLLTEAQGTTVELMQTAMAGDSAAAVAKANSVMTEWSDTIAVNMDTLISRNDELVKQNIQEQKDLYNQNMILSLILLAISFVAFVMVVVVIIKTVVKPLRKQTSELTEIIDEIKGGHGDLTKRVTVKSMDEIGQSSIGINHFIETLQNIMSNIISIPMSLTELSEMWQAVLQRPVTMPMIFPRSWKNFLRRWRRYPQRRTASARIRPLRKAKYRRWQIRPRLCHSMRRI